MDVLAAIRGLIDWASDTFLPNQEQVGALVRWVLTLAGAWAIRLGWLDASQSVLLLGIGAAITPLIWSVIIKTRAARLKSVAEINDIVVQVGPAAPASIQAIAANPAVPNVVVVDGVPIHYEEKK